MHAYIPPYAYIPSHVFCFDHFFHVQDESDLLAKHARMMLRQGVLNCMNMVFSTTAQVYTGR
jgi:hypothetical protein